MNSMKTPKIELKSQESIGTIVNSEKIDEFHFVINKKSIMRICGVGEYIITKNAHGKEILGVISDITPFNTLISNENTSYHFNNDIKPYSNEIMNNSSGFAAKVKIIGLITNNKIEPNKTCVISLKKFMQQTTTY